ncbi:NIF3-related protein [Streptococcus pyogenes MGAS2096]|nr:NIF3-related protein [Streptococcus pyogenes MGAS2096]
MVKHDISVYVSHTNIDIVPGGLNDWFCDLLEIKEATYLSETKEGFGIGRIGTVKEQALEELASKVKRVFDLDTVRLIRYDKENPLISKIAICGGSVVNFIRMLCKKAQTFILQGISITIQHRRC